MIVKSTVTHQAECDECGQLFDCLCGFPDDTYHYCEPCKSDMESVHNEYFEHGEYDLSEKYQICSWDEIYG